MITGMSFDVVLNRPFDKKTDYISFGGYIANFRCSSEICFDFINTYGHFDDNVIHVEQNELDTDSFPVSRFLSQAFFHTNIFEKIGEFYIYLGEDGDSPGLEIKEIRDLKIEFYENGTLDVVYVPSEKIKVCYER